MNTYYGPNPPGADHGEPANYNNNYEKEETSMNRDFHAVIIGKASDVFVELDHLAKWEKYDISFKYYFLSSFGLN